PGVCAHQSPLVIDGSPALLARGGVFRQAIPGLSENASASCLARVCARLFHLGLRCSAQPDGEVRQKPNQKQRQKRKTTSKAEVSFLSVPQPSSSSPRRRGSSSAELDARMRAVKSENPTVKTFFGRPRTSWTPEKCRARYSLTACVPTTNLGTHGTHGVPKNLKVEGLSRSSKPRTVPTPPDHAHRSTPPRRLCCAPTPATAPDWPCAACHPPASGSGTSSAPACSTDAPD
ncbi:MAG: hypothetical protein JWR07_859, partial [Nevskia sp.]|nr:hypothetical protein [Nevskia sp.]